MKIRGGKSVLLFAAILLFLPLILLSQPQTSNWYFSPNQSINWNTFPPKGNSQGPINNRYSSATISDEKGKLLFSTDGSVIYDQNNQPVPNFKLLDTPVRSPDNVVIVPMGVGRYKKYYVFACDAWGANKEGGRLFYHQNDTSLFYTEIPSLNGQPDFSKPLVRKTLAGNVAGALSATFTQGGQCAWLVTAFRPHFRQNDKVQFVAFRFSECGLEETKTSTLPPLNGQIVAGFDYGNCMRIKFSPDGTNIVTCNTDLTEYCLHLSFEPNTGNISLQNVISAYNIGHGSFLFSRDSKYLYFFRLGRIGTSTSYLAKYSLNQKAEIDSLVLWKGTINLVYESFFTMAQHANGHMYFVRSTYQDKSNEPNLIDWGMFELIDDGSRFTAVQQDFWKLRTDNASYVTHYSFSRDPYFSFTNFTNFVESYFDPNFKEAGRPVAKASRVCEGNATAFSATDTSMISSYFWDFGDGSVSVLASPTHLYAQAGTYQARLLLRYSCNADTIPFTVVVDEQPKPVLSDVNVCGSRPVTIKAPGGYISYLWQDGSTDSVYIATGGAKLSLTVTNACGSATTGMTVNKTDIQGPNVFTPNGDGLNDYLIFDNPVQDAPELRVSNRWGKEVFRDSHYQNNWDGSELTAGVYYYDIVYPGCDVYKSWLQIIR